MGKICIKSGNTLPPIKRIGFADFMLLMSSKNIILSHLYDNRRREEGMWQEHHAYQSKEVMQARSPKTAVAVPCQGDILQLS